MVRTLLVERFDAGLRRRHGDGNDQCELSSPGGEPWQRCSHRLTWLAEQTIENLIENYLNAAFLARMLQPLVVTSPPPYSTMMDCFMVTLHTTPSPTFSSYVADAGPFKHAPSKSWLYKALFKVIDPPTAVLHLRPPRSCPRPRSLTSL